MFSSNTRRARSAHSTTLSIVLAITLAVPLALVLPSAPAGAQVGTTDTSRWGPVADWPLIPIHAALDSNGRVVTYGTTPTGQQSARLSYDIWTPNESLAAGHNTLANTTQTDIFCSLQLNRPDTGNMVLFGGDLWDGRATLNLGNPDINEINATTGLMTSLPAMSRSRWYATGVTMPDGSFYVQGGLNGEDRPEHWTPLDGAELLDIDTSQIDWYYPRNFVAPDGRVFGIAADGQMYFVSADLESLQVVGRLAAQFRGNAGSAVMFEPGRILYIGTATDQTLVIDITSGTPVVTSAGTLSSVRGWPNATLLPDGRVLVNGGAVKSESQDDPIETYGVNLAAEIWDPRTGAWTVGPSQQLPRLYHSTAILLPDGRVLTGGGGAPGPVDNLNAELYYPDYLSNPDGTPTDRPAITSASSTDLSAGQTMTLGVNAPNGVSRVTMVKAGSVTHAFNMGQRFMELGFSTNGGTVSAQLPSNTAVLTPGYYLVTVLDANGIPSESQMVRVAATGAPVRPPTGVEGEVLRLYRAFFLRQPDAEGFAFWTGERRAGLPLTSIATAFSTSAEFTGRYGALSNPAFVDLVYRNVLGRTPDAEGRAHWIGVLDSGVSRGEMMVGFSESAEFRARVETGTPAPTPVVPTPPQPEQPQPAPTPPAGELPTDALSLEVRRLYMAYFLRQADAEGLAYWTGQRRAGLSLNQVSALLAGSGEFQARYGSTSNAQFVDLVYANVLNRRPDDEGRAYWIDQLNQGLSRGEMMVEFSESAEYRTVTNRIFL